MLVIKTDARTNKSTHTHVHVQRMNGETTKTKNTHTSSITDTLFLTILLTQKLPSLMM